MRLALAQGQERAVRRARGLAWALVLALAGCATVPDVSKFLYATNEDRDNADVLADAADAASDVAPADTLPLDGGTDAADATDVADTAADADAATDGAADGDGADGAGDGDAAAEVDVAPTCAQLGTCSDGNACTVDSCVEGTGCVHLPLDASACADASLCNIDSCDKILGCVHVALDVTKTCDDSDACTTDGCEDDVGCTHGTLSCDDGDLCTLDNCTGATGCGHVKVPCDDGKVCTLDACDPITGCVSTPVDGTPCDDGNACTGGDVCKVGICAGAAITCGGGNPCVVNSCDPAKGCVATNADGTACDDGDACTADDSCSGGGCSGKPRLWHVTVAADQEALAIAPRSDGGFVTVSRSGKITTVRAWSKDGTNVWTNTLAAGASRAGVAVAANGDVAVASGNGTDGVVAIYQADGTVIANTIVPSKSAGGLDAIIADAAGGYHVAGYIQGAAGDPGDAWFGDVDAKGTASALTSAGGPSLDALYTAIVTSDGDYAIGGIASLGQTSGAFLFKTKPGTVAPNKNSLWVYTYPSTGSGRFNQIAPAGDGGVLAVGEVDAAGDGQLSPLTVRLDGNGRVLWSHLEATTGAKLTGSGAAVLAGDHWITATVTNGLNLTAYSADGLPVWTRTEAGLTAPKLIALADGTVGLASGSSTGLQVERLDPYGNADCASSGTCIAQSFAACSDGNVCTSDDCAGGSCSHGDTFFGIPCADGDGCHGDGKCDSGSCLNSGDLLGYTTDTAWGEGSAIASLPNDGWVMATSPVGGAAGFAVVSYSAATKQKWSKAYPQFFSGKIFGTSNNDTLAAGFDTMTGNVWMRRLDSSGAETGSWSFPVAGVTAFTVAGGMEAQNGGYILLGTDAVNGYLLHVGVDGQLTGQQTMNNAQQVRRPVPTSDGGFYVTGNGVANGQWTPFLAKFTQSGNQTWRYDYPSAGVPGTASFTDPAVLPDGGCAVVVASDTPHVLRFSPAGTLVRTDSFQASATPVASAPAAVVATSDGSLILTTVIGAATTAWRLDPQGNLAGSLVLPATPGPGIPVSVAVSAKDRVAFTSAVSGTMNLSLGLWRVDAFLNSACKVAGGCASKLAATCATGNSCVLDGCLGGACQHTTRKDGAACADDSPCTWGDTCGSGICLAGAPVLGKFLGMAQQGVGVVTSGANTVDIGNVGGTQDFVVAEQRDPTGTVAWVATSPSGKQAGNLHAVVDAGGNVLIPGHDDTNDAAWIWRLDSTGVSLDGAAGLQYGAGNGSTFRTLIANAGGYWAVGTTGTVGAGSGPDFWVLPLNAALATTGSSWTFGTLDAQGGANTDVATAAALGVSGALFIAGTTTPNTGWPPAGRVIKVDPLSGSQMWEYTNPSGTGSSVEDVVATSDGGCFAVGMTPGIKSQDLWVARFGQWGDQLWSRTVDDAGGAGTDDVGYGAATLVDGTFAVVGRTTAAHLWRYGALGEDLGDWSLAADRANRVTPSSTGGLLIAATAGTPSGNLVLHTDLFGNPSCTASGACFGYDAAACDDKNPCTLDVCQGQCLHTNVPDGLACQDSDACTVEEFCTAGSCGSGKSGLWTALDLGGNVALLGTRGSTATTVTGPTVGVTAQYWGAAGELGSAVAAPGTAPGIGRMQVDFDGSFVVPGRTMNGIDVDAWLTRYSADQNVIWAISPGVVGSVDRFDAVVPRQSGGFWAVGTHTAATGVPSCWLQAVGANDGALGQSVDLFGGPGSVACVNARADTDGTVVVAGSATNAGTTYGFVGKVNSGGSQQFSTTYLSGGGERFFDVIPAFGGAIAVGTSSPTGTPGSDMLLMRVDPTGAKVWVRKLDFGGADEGRALYHRQNDSLDVAGACNGAFCLAHLTPTGNLLWQQSYGAGRALQLAPLGYNGLILAGESVTGNVVRIDWSGDASCTAANGCASYGETSCSGNDQCSFARCSKGNCTTTALSDGAPCDDGQACTGGDMCAFGQCVGGTGSPCGDGICDCGETIATCPGDCQ